MLGQVGLWPRSSASRINCQRTVRARFLVSSVYGTYKELRICVYNRLTGERHGLNFTFVVSL